MKSVTVWTDVKGSSEKTLENPQEDATVAFVVPRMLRKKVFSGSTPLRRLWT